MILFDREIKLALMRDYIRITPVPPDSAITSTSVDLTLCTWQRCVNPAAQ